jgi:hypothetical protein
LGQEKQLTAYGASASRRPTQQFYQTSNSGRTRISPGVHVSEGRHQPSDLA